MSILTASDICIISKCLGMIGSAHDGEALAAARKAHQLVTAKGVTWGQVLGLGEMPPTPEPDHVALARDLLGRGKGIISAWEKQFLVGVMAYGSLKEKQRDMLEYIARKVANGSDTA